MNSILVCAAIAISIGCYFIWSWAHAHLFTYLGEVETCSGVERCYAYDVLSWPARIVAFLCGAAAIMIFELTWFAIYGILFVW
jgi:hypothetical protein